MRREPGNRAGLSAGDVERARRIAASAPPLTERQREELRAILTGACTVRAGHVIGRGGEHAA